MDKLQKSSLGNSKFPLWSALVWLLAAAAAPGNPSDRDDRPNIILLMADDLSWVDTSSGPVCLGNESGYHETPNIEKLAGEGLSFTHAYAQQNCMPTRASVISGQYAPANNVYNVGSLNRPARELEGRTAIVPPDQQKDLSPEGLSVAEFLSRAGYTTAIFGKTHGLEPAADLKENHGFGHNMSVDKRFRFWHEGEDWKAKILHDYLAIEGTDGRWHYPSPAYQQYAAPYDREYVQRHLIPLRNGNNPHSLLRNSKHPSPKHLTDAMTDAVEDFIGDQAESGTPFFIYLPYHAVHSNFVARPDLDRKYVRKRSEDPRHDFPTYGAMVEGMDQSVGRILRALDDPDGNGDDSDSLAGKTVVIFYSDNGGSDNTSNLPLRGRKGMFYEGGIRVPLIVRHKGHLAEGEVTDEAVHSIDFYPTFAELANIPLPGDHEHTLDGESWVKVLRGQDMERRDLFWHFPGYMDDRQRPNSLILSRIGRDYYKLFYFYEEDRFELYNISRDLGERQNLMEGTIDASHKRIAVSMSIRLREWLQESGARMGTWRESGETVGYPPVFAMPAPDPQSRKCP